MYFVFSSGRSAEQQGVCCRHEEQAAARPRETQGHWIC